MKIRITKQRGGGVSMRISADKRRPHEGVDLAAALMKNQKTADVVSSVRDELLARGYSGELVKESANVKVFELSKAAGA